MKFSGSTAHKAAWEVRYLLEEIAVISSQNVDSYFFQSIQPIHVCNAQHATKEKAAVTEIKQSLWYVHFPYRTIYMLTSPLGSGRTYCRKRLITKCDTWQRMILKAETYIDLIIISQPSSSACIKTGLHHSWETV